MNKSKFCPYTLTKSIIGNISNKKEKNQDEKILRLNKIKTKFNLFSEIKKEFGDKVEKSIETSENTDFDEILEKLAEFYLKELNENFSEEYLETMLNIKDEQDMFTGFGNYFQMIFNDMIFRDFRFSEQQDEILEKRLGKRYSLNNEIFSGLIYQAFLDIFLLKILQKKFPKLSDKKINQIIQKNMFVGTMIKGNISEEAILGLRYEKDLDEIIKNLDEINEKIPGIIANCPFFHIKNQKKWIFGMMKFFDEKIIPKIPENSYLFTFKK